MTWKDHRLALLALTIWLSLAVHTACSTSVTHDEIWHLPAGLRAWSGDFTPDRVNPPLSRLWAALPLRLIGVTAAPATNANDLGHQFTAAHENYLRWYFLGRLFNLVWPLLTAVLIYVWSLQSHGLAVARTALMCFLCCPNVLAHGALVTADSAAMCGFLATSYCLTRWLNELPASGASKGDENDPGLHRGLVVAMVFGVVLGLLQASKFHGVVFYPVIVGCGLIAMVRAPRRWLVLAQMLLIIVISLAVLAILYGGQHVGRAWGDYQFASRNLQAWQAASAALKLLPMPVPADYLLGIDQQMVTMESPHPVYLDGVWQIKGFPDYFAKSLLYKLSHAYQALILCGLFAAWRNRAARVPWMAVSIWAPVLLLFTAASMSDLQLGMRYVLPIIPALAMLAGRSVELLAGFAPGAQRFLIAFLFLALLSPLRFHPHHLAYFNEYAGGPVGGRYHLVDSNLDWGQDLWRAQEFIAAHADENPRFLYFGTADPRKTGIDVTLPPSLRPRPGLYVVSVNFVMGRPHSVLLPNGEWRSLDVHEFSYFRLFEPAARCGYSIDVYRITSEDIERVKSRESRAKSQR